MFPNNNHEGVSVFTLLDRGEMGGKTGGLDPAFFVQGLRMSARSGQVPSHLFAAQSLILGPVAAKKAENRTRPEGRPTQGSGCIIHLNIAL